MTLTGGDLPSFGVLLKALRTRKHFTQQQLAGAIGVHRHAIGRWEQGEVLPASKAMVLELARHLCQDDQEARHLLEASLTALSPYFLVPLPRNPFFTGREEILEALHAQLGVNQAVALTGTSALHGLGGVGKTQIALEYAYRHALDYSAVFWIGAESSEHILSSLQRIAEVLQLPGRDEKDQQRVVEAVQQWLTTHSQWLLIWDNVEDLALLDRFLPAARRGAILLTTRCQVLGTLARGMDLLPMGQGEGMLFLLRRAKVVEPEATPEHVQQFAVHLPAEYAATEQLITAMGGLPLALDQAGAYIEETHCSLQAYLDLFHAHRVVLLQQRGEGSRSHPESVSTTLRLSITATAGRHPAMWDLLRVCALLQPDAIPEELFRQGIEHLGATLETICRDELDWNRLVAVACSYSLLHRQTEEQTLSMHRLVQAVLLDTMTEEEGEQWSRRVIETLDALFPEITPSTAYASWQQCQRLLPHALVCLHRAGEASETLALASLAYKAALYLYARGQYGEVEPLFQRALSIRERILGQNHPEVPPPLNHLALLYWSQGRYAEAEPLFQRALSIWEQTLGPEHSEVARPLNNLALLYRDQGKYAEAEPLFQRALSIWEQTLGPDHLNMARPLNNLALLYTDQGKYAEAEPLFQRALHISEHLLGPDHPDVARPLNNLGDLYRVQGKYREAEPLFQHALHIWEQALGHNHPFVAYPFTGLAELYWMQGKYAQAEPLFQRALHIWEQALGHDHSQVAEPLNGLANLYRDQGRYVEAEPLLQRALSVREQHLGQHHPETAQTLHDLAILRQKQGDLGEALSLAERALQIRSQALGDIHPQTVATYTLYTHLVQDQGRLEEGESSEACAKKRQKPFEKESVLESISISPQASAHSSPSENNPIQEFLDACCECHPRAWCRSSDLWQAYKHWVEERQERFPLSRRAFATELKARGCRADRTKTARIWRGITIAPEAVHQKMTQDDTR